MRGSKPRSLPLGDGATPGLGSGAAHMFRNWIRAAFRRGWPLPAYSLRPAPFHCRAAFALTRLSRRMPRPEAISPKAVLLRLSVTNTFRFFLPHAFTLHGGGGFAFLCTAPLMHVRGGNHQNAYKQSFGKNCKTHLVYRGKAPRRRPERNRTSVSGGPRHSST